MKRQEITEVEALQAAFEAFNRISGDLETSYRELQADVQRLERQLDDAHRDRAEEARRNAELARRLAALLEALPGGVLMLDGDGVIRDLNATAATLLGEPLQDAPWPQVRDRAFRPGATDGGDLTLQDGRQLSLAQKLLEPGPGRVLLFTDVTEHRKVQEMLARHQRLAALGEMAAALAHQIRTPLSAALLYTSNATRPELELDRRTAMLDKATRCLHDLEQLVGDMLEFARGARPADGQATLAEMLDGVRDSAEAAIRPGQSVRFRVRDGAARVRGSREALSGAILNLVINALQQAGDGARVEVDARVAGMDAEIRVRDNGPGVPATERGRIFDPFFTTRADGTGLGLAVVRSVARAHQGDVLLEDSAGGASFLLRVPAIRVAARTGLPARAAEEVAA
jgi:two-component system sensor histidine kinase FlrB